VWVVAGAAFAASLFALYRISAEPSFFVGPAVVEAVAGFAVVVVAVFLVFAGVVCAFEHTLIPTIRNNARNNFFINGFLFQLI
jgi:hypothetical protein